MERDAKVLVIANAVGQLFLQFSWFVMPFYLKVLGYGMDKMGVLFSVQTFIGGLSFLLAGQISLRIGYKRTLILAALLGLLGRILQVIGYNFYILILGFFLVGINMGLRDPNYSALLSEKVKSEEERHRIFSYSFGLGTLMNAIGVLVAGYAPGYLISLGYRKEIAYRLVIALALLQFLVVIPALMLVKDVPVKESRIKWRKDLIVRILKFSLPSAIIGLGAGITIPYMSIYFNLRFGRDIKEISWVFFGQQLVMGLGSFILPELVRKIGAVKVITYFQWSAALLFLIFPSIPTFILASIVYVIRSILMNIVWPVNDSFMMGFFSTEEKATAAGIRRAFSTFMRGAGNYIGGLLFAVSLSYPFYATAILYIFATAMFYAFFIKHN
ncbi:MFS transporter [Pyrococcus abyssi]|uniref:Multidrug resistance protein n=1 Tax=Pyrococcus abyssi (strain GE5 / Orsay) TaxID=272844 RepID=Q9V264_PYRAB|nr:MFS transporter [Pyrococcus abyssi]CAB49134.1 Putative permease, major facilitator superfamily [Pyrococcus abyssi GE5]CCE69586.1 TPA: multidrug resistance protein [Pyrococcus abyssi GE5]